MFNANVITQVRQVIQTCQQIVYDFLDRRYVVACGVGFKIKGVQQTWIPSIVFSVTRKVPPDRLSPSDLIPKMIQNIATDVIETGEIEALGLNRLLPLRPVRPGASIGHRDGTTGTLSCIVQRGDQRFLLSNNHIIARLNEAKLGDSILQPGTADGGTAADEIGQLAMYAPIRFLENMSIAEATALAQSTDAQGCYSWLKSLLETLGSLGHSKPTSPVSKDLLNNHVDAALVAPLSNILLDPNIIDIGGPPVGIVEPQLGMRIVKSGRTTGLTEARIVQIDVTVNVKYGDQMARFANQIMTTPFSQPGDSGSLVLDFERRAVGLLFSGSSQITVVNPIKSVLSTFDVELVTA